MVLIIGPALDEAVAVCVCGLRRACLCGGGRRPEASVVSRAEGFLCCLRRAMCVCAAAAEPEALVGAQCVPASVGRQLKPPMRGGYAESCKSGHVPYSDHKQTTTIYLFW